MIETTTVDRVTTGNIADYQGRTADVSLFQGVREGERNRLAMRLADPDSSGQLITGSAKLAQRFFLELTTELGTIFGNRSRGCDFMRQLRLGSLRTTGEIEQAFHFSIDQIVDDLLEDQQTATPLDEAFADVTLTEVLLEDRRLKLTITLRSLAGERRQVILPINTRIR